MYNIIRIGTRESGGLWWNIHPIDEMASKGAAGKVRRDYG
jgi:hypothetical protein